MTDQPAPPAGDQPPPFDPSADHHQKPRLRRHIRTVVQMAKGPDGQPQQIAQLVDSQRIAEKSVALPLQFAQLLPMFDGDRSLDDIAASVGRGLTRQMLEPLVAALDGAGLLFGPRFEAMRDKVRSQFDDADVLPPGSTAELADALVVQALGPEATDEQKTELGAEKLASAMDTWIDQALKNQDNPSFDALPKAVVAPHLDYMRGWPNYAGVWGRMRVVDRPDRVIVLGTNHFGDSTGVCGSDKGYSTPFGECSLDRGFLDTLKKHLGDEGAQRLFEHRYDHEHEHSIELQIAWLQHVLGKDDAGNHVPVFAALVHDPAVNNGESYDGEGLALEPFVEAMRATIDEVGGRTLVVSSADLSHIGPAFGEKFPLVNNEEGEAKVKDTERHDQEMLKHFVEGDLEGLIAAMAWQQNPTRWCSVGNMVAAHQIVGAEKADLLGYTRATDQQGHTMVSSAAVALW